MLYMITFTINIPPMLVYIPYMDPMGRYMAALQVNWSDEEFHSALRELQKEDSSPPPGVSPSRFD